MLRSGLPPGKRALLLALLLAACSRSPDQAPGFEAETHPAPPGALTPDLAVDGRGRLLASWVTDEGETHALWLATRDGDGWSAPERLAEGSNWFVNWADFPGIAAAPGLELVHWREKTGASTYDYAIRVRTRSEGGTWTEPTTLHVDGVAAEHGFVDSWAEPDGGLGLSWLDGRRTPDGGPMTLRSVRLAPDGTRHDRQLLDDRVCDCCQTGAAMTPAGPVVAFRDRSEAEVRDIGFVRRDGPAWTAPRRVAADDWQIAACPVNGPAVASGSDHVFVAWFTAAADDARVQLAWSPHGADRFSDPILVDGEFPVGRVDLSAIGADRVALSYLASSGDDAEVRVVIADPSGVQAVHQLGTTSPARGSGFPRLAATATDLWIAWRDVDADTGDQLRLARLPLAPAGGPP